MKLKPTLCKWAACALATSSTLLTAATVFAADSGTAIATPVNTWGKVIQDDVGYGAGVIGGALLLGGMATGREHHGVLYSGVGCIIGGAVCHNYPTWAGNFTMSAAATIHLVNHPMVHHLVRLVS
jgi:hypothetical protein